MSKTLRVRTREGWATKPAPDLDENRLTAEEIDDNFLAMEDADHTQNTDTSLAHGTANAVTAAQLAGIRDNLPAQLNRKAAEQAVVTTYAASGSTGIQIADNANINFGTGDFTLVWRGSLPDWSVGANVYFFDKRLSSTVRFQFFRLNTGVVRLSYNTGSAAENLDFSSVNFTDGSVGDITVSVQRESPSSAGVAKLYFNGTYQSEAVIATGTTPDLTNTADLQIMGSQGARYAAQTHFAATYNRALSAAEVWDLYVNGVSEADKWGSQVPDYESDFSSNTGWSLAAGASINTGTGKLTFAASETRGFALRSNHFAENAVLFNSYWECVYVVDSNDSNTELKITGVNRSANAVVDTPVHAPTTPGTHRVVFKADATTGTRRNIGFNTVAPITSGSIVISNFKLTKLGATLALEPEGINTDNWLDASSNKLNATYPATGWSLKRPSYDAGEY